MAKKFLALLLALVMVISLVACGTANAPVETEAPKGTESLQETEAPKVDPADVKFTVLLQANIEDANEMPITQVFEEATGYKPEYIEISSAAWEEQLQLMWLDEELPNVIIHLDEAAITTAAANGQIIDLAPYLKNAELMPNLNKSMDDYYWDVVSDSEGHIWSFPKFINARLKSGLNINVEWLKKLGLEKPETPDELLEVWRAFKEKDPNGNGLADEIPFSSELIFSNAMETLDPMFGMFGATGGWQVDENGKVFFGQTTEAYKEGLKWFRDAYAEGLIDAEIFTQDMTGFTAKGQTNPPTYGMTLSYTWGAQNRVHTDETVVQYDYLLPMKAADGVRYWWNNSAYPIENDSTTVITTGTECIEDICRWIDCMYDPDIGYQISAAPYGYGLVRHEEGENAGKYESGSTACPDANFGEYADYATWRGAMHNYLFPVILTDYTKEVWGYDEVINNTTLVYNTQDVLYRENCTLTNYLDMDGATEEEAEIEATYLSEFKKLYRSQCASWIAGNGDIDAEWDAFQQSLVDMGLEELIAVYQARYDRIH